MRFTPLRSASIGFLLLAALIFLALAIGNASDTENRPQDNLMQDKVAVLGLILSQPDLRTFFHPDSPERDTLLVIGSGLPNGIKLHHSDSPLVLTADDSRENCIVLSWFFLGSHSGFAKFEYGVEGVFGYFLVWKAEDGWRIDEMNISLH